MWGRGMGRTTGTGALQGIASCMACPLAHVWTAEQMDASCTCTLCVRCAHPTWCPTSISLHLLYVSIPLSLT